MDNILDLLKGSLGKEVVDGISRNTDASPEQTQAVISNALPALLGGLQSNASDSNGAQGILNAIGSKHDGSILDNLSGFLGSNDTSDGNSILGHILGNKQSAVEQSISGKTGVSSGTVSKIMAMLAPIVMGFLGKQSRSNNISDGNGLSNILSGMLGGQSGSGILGSMLDQNGDGKLGVDDVGGLLGGLFGKK